jgi:hypothetical protein
MCTVGTVMQHGNESRIQWLHKIPRANQSRDIPRGWIARGSEALNKWKQDPPAAQESIVRCMIHGLSWIRHEMNASQYSARSATGSNYGVKLAEHQSDIHGEALVSTVGRYHNFVVRIQHQSVENPKIVSTQNCIYLYFFSYQSTHGKMEACC